MPKTVQKNSTPLQPAQPEISTIQLRPQIVTFAKQEASADVESRIVTLVASDETPLLRFDWENWEPYELVISHDPKHVDLSRVNSGVAMFFDNHPGFFGGTRLGKIKSADLTGRRLTVQVKLNRSPEADRYLQDVEDGVEPGNSIGFTIRKLEVVSEAEYTKEGGRSRLSKPAVMKAVDWELDELSAVDIPANPNAGSQSQFSLSKSEREQLEKLPLYPVQLSGNPGYLKESEMGKNAENSNGEELDQDSLTEVKELRTQLRSAKGDLQDAQDELATLKTERQYFELRSIALEAVALSNQMTEDEFSENFGDVNGDLKKLEKLSSEDRRIELKFLGRTIERAMKRDPLERVEKESDRTKLGKTTITSKTGEGNPATATLAKEDPKTPTGENVDEYAQRLVSRLSHIAV